MRRSQESITNSMKRVTWIIAVMILWKFNHIWTEDLNHPSWTVDWAEHGCPAEWFLSHSLFPIDPNASICLSVGLPLISIDLQRKYHILTAPKDLHSYQYRKLNLTASAFKISPFDIFIWSFFLLCANFITAFNCFLLRFRFGCFGIHTGRRGNPSRRWR